jgi:hypothetical protein
MDELPEADDGKISTSAVRQLVFHVDGLRPGDGEADAGNGDLTRRSVAGHLDDNVKCIIVTHRATTEKLRLALKCGVPIVTPSLFMLLNAFEDHVLNWSRVNNKQSPLFKGKTFEIRERHEAALTALTVTHRGVASRRADAVLVVPYGGFLAEEAPEQVTAVLDSRNAPRGGGFCPRRTVYCSSR